MVLLQEDSNLKVLLRAEMRLVDRHIMHTSKQSFRVVYISATTGGGQADLLKYIETFLVASKTFVVRRDINAGVKALINCVSSKNRNEFQSTETC